ncbi:MAG TPA: nitrite/sulfite reductase [Thermoanaerobaculia bacterium]|jgi:sulfite reductase (NADPH) hemoprotein beta-component|nr:nitrite/sulfite reductase [Thermoanaerobaculia bacterium]HEV8608820.1 nitrite/sulfite reductase [Thermoanaerobaculia bacterium]
MAAVDDPKTLGRASLSFASEAEIDEFVATLEKFERGELTPDQWRAFRLVRGTYTQRQEGDFAMLRVKIPQGILSSDQLAALADVAETYSRGFGHITTRQNVQFHFMKLHDVEHAMRRLAEAGLTTREACGNSVRNVTGCPYAGVGFDEVFDVTPYADALTRYLLRHPLSSSLPRKFKIAWEGCSEDHALTPIHDIGWRARVEDRDGRPRRGFRVIVGGGTSNLCRSAAPLFDFLPAGEILNVAEAIVRVFHRLGDREHKNRNRMKFLIKELGWERWREEVESALVEFRREGGASLPFDPESPPVEEEPRWERACPLPVALTRARATASKVSGPGLTPEVLPFLPVMNGDFSRWSRTNTRPQKQVGFAIVTVTVPLGDLTGGQLRVIGDLALAYADGSVRVTSEQDLLLRWVPTANVGQLYRQLAAAGLALPDANTIADVTSCPGAESCRIAVTQSRGLGRFLGDHLRARPDLVAAASDLQIKISGCPNGCGRHHIAGLGFQGSTRRVGDRVVPQYLVMVGGAVDDQGAQFGRVAARIPARRTREALDRLIALYQGERSSGETATAFFRRAELDSVHQVLADLEKISPADALPTDYVDLGEDADYKVETKEGECAV